MSTKLRRIVLEHTTGPHPGLKQILGTDADFAGKTPPATTPEFDITPGTRRGIARLVAAKPTYLHYRELKEQA